MSNTGYDWGDWAELLSSSPSASPDSLQVLNVAGPTRDSTETIDLDVKAACEVSIIATYTNHAQAAGTGLFVYILREVKNNDFEEYEDGAFNFLMEFTQNGTRKKTISISPADMGKFRIGFDWTNSTGSSGVTISAYYKTATIPAAS